MDNSENTTPLSTEKAAIKTVVDNYTDSERYYRRKFEQFNYFDSLYKEGSQKKNNPHGRANLGLPIAFQQVEDYTAKMVETAYSEAPYIAYAGRDINDDPVAEQITKFTQKQMDDGKIIKAGSNYYRNLGKYGTAVMKVPWVVEEQEVTETKVEEDPLTGELVETEETFTLKTFDGPKFINLSIFDFFVPRWATSTDITQLSWCIHRTWRSVDDILKNPNYKNKDKVKNINAKMENSERQQTKARELAQHNVNGRRKFKGKIEVLEWWGDYELVKGQGKVPSLITVAIIDGEEVLLRRDENPLKFKLKPFVASNDYPIEGEFYGYGEIHHIKGLITESTALRNSRLDVANLSINHMWLVERQSGINLRSLFTAPNKVVLTNDNSGIKRMDMGGVTPSSVNELSRIDFDIQNTTQIINPAGDVAGVGPGFGNTATGVAFLSSKANLRTLLKVRIQEQDFFQPLSALLNQYNKQFIKSEQFFRVYDGEDNPYETLPNDAFATQVDFKPVSNPEKINRDGQKANLDYLLQVVAQIEKVKPGTSNLVNLLEEVYRVSGFPRPDRFVNKHGPKVFVTPDGQTFIDEKGQPVDVQQLTEEDVSQGG